MNSQVCILASERKTNLIFCCVHVVQKRPFQLGGATELYKAGKFKSWKAYSKDFNFPNKVLILQSKLLKKKW